MGLTSYRRATWVAIQRNPTSGAGPQRALVLDLVRGLIAHGFSPRVFKSREKLSGWLSAPDHRAGLKCLVAVGGDGTVADVFNRFPDIPLAILPAGTENLLARHLKIPRSGTEVADLIAQGKTRKIDLCALGERRFAIMASAGFDADVIHRAHALRHGHITRADYFKPIFDSLRTYDYPEMRLWMDDAPTPMVARLAVITNLPTYALGLQVAKSARGDDGSLDLRLFEGGSAFQMARYFYNLANGTHEELQDVNSVSAKRIRIESDTPIPLQVDGDPAGWTPAEIRVIPAALEVFAPA